MNIDLTNLNILVTGASKGIGFAIARQLAISGARVAIHYNNSGKKAIELATFLGNNSIAFKADFSDQSQILRLFDEVLVEFGHLDVIINNAGIALNSPIETSDAKWLDDWEQTLTVNLTATALLCKKSLSHFLTRNSGRIINIASRAAFRGDTAGYLAYAASKGGMVALTRSLARAYGKQGIKAFLLAPGFTKTAMAQEFIDAYGEDFTKNDISLDRITVPEDIVPLVVLLASGLADHATGCTIDVNAGSYVH
ncbi:MAG: SDR family oxidoreductase [Bacteroidota bacterium]|nr:SDR family oxidoreductase [Bacteroidota bacterium]